MEEGKELATVSRPQIERQKLFQYLPKAVDRIVKAMDSEDEKIALGAARWIAEQCIGKPGNNISEDDAHAFGAGFAKALREAHEEAASRPAIEEPIFEGQVRILGNPISETSTEGLLFSESALAEIDDF